MKSLRTLISLAFISLGVQAFAQDLGNFYGGFESNSQWLQDDQDLGFTAPKDQFRSNNYFLLNYEQGKFKAGLQYESYLPRPMLGYDPVLEGNQIANYYVNFTDKSLDITATCVA